MEKLTMMKNLATISFLFSLLSASITFADNPPVRIPPKLVTAPTFEWKDHTQEPRNPLRGRSVTIRQEWEITKGKYIPAYNQGENPPDEEDLEGSFSKGNPVVERVNRAGATDSNPAGIESVEFEGEFSYTNPEDGRKKTETESTTVHIFFAGGSRGTGGGGTGGDPVGGGRRSRWGTRAWTTRGRRWISFFKKTDDHSSTV